MRSDEFGPGAPAEAVVLVRGGRVVDGTGNPWRYADVIVKGERILDVIPRGQFTGHVAQIVDAEDCVVAPGFVDIHSHSDLALLAQPDADQKLRQGITTEVVGNCGISVAPTSDKFAEACRQYATPVLGFGDVNWDWSDVDGYLARVDRAHPAVNVATYVGLGSIRCAVSGFQSETPSSPQRQRMRDLVARALQQGAVGLSSGLVYAPGSYSSHGEICELVAEAARVGALYSSHMRDQGDGFLDSVAETLDVGRRTGAAVHIAHHKVVGQRNWGAVTQSLALLQEARTEGIDVGSDVYPYLAGSTTMTALLPPWVLAGGVPSMLQRLVDPAQRARIKEDWVRGRAQWDNRVASIGWENIYISNVSTSHNQRLVGMSVADAASRGAGPADPGDFLLDLLVDESGAVGNIQMACSEQDLRQVMQDPTTCIGSDGLFAGGRPHPRLHGTFPRVLGEYVRESGVLSLEEAVRKMTSQPARRLGLAGIGLIEPGYRADLVVFDPLQVSGPATYKEPTQHPLGIRHVLVSGRPAVRDGQPTGIRAGRSLRRSQPTSVSGPQD